MNKKRIRIIINYAILIIIFVIFIGALEDNCTINAQEYKQEIVNIDENKENIMKNNSRSVVNNAFRGDFCIDAAKLEIDAGDIANFNLYLKITGSNTEFNNAKLEIVIPKEQYLSFKQNLDELIIAKVKPTLKNNILVWNFKKLNAGIMDKLVLKIKTENGLSPNGSKVILNGTFSADNLVDDHNKQTKIKESAQINIKSNGKLATTNYFNKVLDTSYIAPSQGDVGIWDFSFSVPKLSYGSKFIKEGSTIHVEYRLDKLIEYQDVYGNTPKPTKIQKNDDGSLSLIWEFKAPSYELQQKDAKHIFEQNFQLKLYFPPTIPQFQIVSNTVTGKITFFDDTNVSSTSLNSSIAVLISNPNIIATEGTPWTIKGSSPKDAVGGVSSNNQDVKVYDSALLGFGLYTTMGYADNALWGPTKYYIDYEVDDHLDIDKFYSGDFYYRPNSKFPGGLPIKKDVVYDIYVKYGTKANHDQDYSLFLENVRPQKWFHNINTKGKHISEIQVRFHANDKNNQGEDCVPAGTFSTNVNFYFTIEKGYVGQVVNRVKDVEMTRIWGADGYLIMDYGNGTNDWPELMSRHFGPYSANIMPSPTGETKVARTGIGFSNTTGNLIDPGHNTLKVSVTNDAASIANLNGPFESYILLPIGINLENDIANDSNYQISKVSDNYHNTNQQLIKLTWSNKRLVPKSSINGEINVQVTKQLTDSFNIKVFTYFNDQDFIVPKIDGIANAMDTYKVKDIDDFNNNGNRDEDIITSGNNYIFNNNNILEVSQSISTTHDKNVSFASVVPKSDVTINLLLNNNTDINISKVVLIDVLPSLNDKGLSIMENRNSKFNLTLKGPIVIPKEWENKVKVQYSVSKNPKIAGVIDQNTTYLSKMHVFADNAEAENVVWLNENEVTNWQDVYSFKIESNKDINFLRGTALAIKLNMSTPGIDSIDPNLLDEKISKYQRAAYNSFAISTNNSQVVEPNKVGVALKLKADPIKPNIPNKPNDLNTKKHSQIPSTGIDHKLIYLSFSGLIGLLILLKFNKKYLDK
ncbi:MAG: hypothetical protein LBT75_02145 [Bacilli bacterium]|jgi:hypothetical protein|nr:hypothetical protein [Bacilli bacterium]